MSDQRKNAVLYKVEFHNGEPQLRTVPVLINGPYVWQRGANEAAYGTRSYLDNWQVYGYRESAQEALRYTRRIYLQGAAKDRERADKYEKRAAACLSLLGGLEEGYYERSTGGTMTDRVVWKKQAYDAPLIVCSSDVTHVLTRGDNWRVDSQNRSRA